MRSFWSTTWPTSAISSCTAPQVPNSNGWPRCTRMSPRSGASPSAPEPTSSSSAITFRLIRRRFRRQNGPNGPGWASAGQQPQAATVCARSRLNARRPRHPASRGLPGQVVQQRRLAHTRLTAHDQDPALTGPHGTDGLAEYTLAWLVRAFALAIMPTWVAPTAPTARAAVPRNRRRPWLISTCVLLVSTGDLLAPMVGLAWHRVV